MPRLSFEKFEGLGNDFLLVAGPSDLLAPSLVARLCDRHFGVGADGVLQVLPPENGGVARMRVVNADGTVPEMCGNGLRCVALHVARREGVGHAELDIETDAGTRRCRVDVRGEGAEVDVDMGVVRVLGERTLDALGREVAVVLADAGNPHAVVYVDEPAAALHVLGPALTAHPSFPRGSNVELVRWNGGVLDVHVWERGVGPTLACGTGACAAVAVAVSRQEAGSGATVRVRLPGGDLLVTHDAATGSTRMKGPARRVFGGDWGG